MGICCCKIHETLREDSYDSSGRALPHFSANMASCSDHTDHLVLDALSALRKLAENSMEPPECMTILHSLAEEEEGWLNVVKSCIFAIPLEDSLGAAVVCLLLDECPLPTRDAIHTLSSRLRLSKDLQTLVFHTNQGRRESELTPSICRNLAVVLACLADKLAGPLSIVLLTQGTLEFLIQRLTTDEYPGVVLNSILALEKFAQTSENKLTIRDTGIMELVAKIEREWLGSKDFEKHQAGFCSQWLLDNSCKYCNRPYSYEIADLSKINVMLNNNDVSDYLKISPTGLEARCDASSFESVRCTFCVSSGVWYYEVTLLTAGVMQIGWATKDSKFLNHEGYGIGDDEYSYAYDGCRQLIWHGARSTPHHHKPWKPGDVLGLLIDLARGKVKFSLNGSEIERDFKEALSGAGFFAAASFMSFQHCIFNFGAQPFKFPPQVSFSSFNDHANMKAEDKIILPRHLKLAAIRQESVTGDPCKICYENAADTRLEPCNHRDVCMKCAIQMEDCPLCRKRIENREFEIHSVPISPKDTS
ncbi:RING finger and SPRY domain-containing protein 1-like [Porites lutea]|uniref:RING finger and SPRY domain-containing protein 1-like n=1 Tax=Porites lutea TaxID=51062 RepID=UPI003CC61D09